jgi:hypothetical protein
MTMLNLHQVYKNGGISMSTLFAVFILRSKIGKTIHEERGGRTTSWVLSWQK